MKTSGINRVLYQIAIGGAFVVIGTGFWVKSRIRENIKRSEFYREAITLLRRNRLVIEELGEPIKDSGADLSNTQKNFADGLRAVFDISVKGPKNSGVFHFESSRNSYDEKWIMQNASLKIQEPEPKILILVKRKNGSDVDI